MSAGGMTSQAQLHVKYQVDRGTKGGMETNKVAYILDHLKLLLLEKVG